MAVKNRFIILNQIQEEKNIVRHRECGTKDIVLGDSQVTNLEIELSNIRKFRARMRVDMYYPGADNDFIKDRLQGIGELSYMYERIALEIGIGHFRCQKYY